MRSATLIILAVFTFVNFVIAEATITNSLVVDLCAPRHPIPDDFLGFSFEESELLPDSTGQHQFSPRNALLMFHLGSLGSMIPMVSDVTNLNFCGYAVIGNDGDLYLTLVNKEYKASAQTAPVNFSIKGGRLLGVGESLALLAPNNDLRAKSGVTLGGKPVTDDGTWSGKWEPLPDSAFAKDGTLSVVVPSASALLVRLSLKIEK